jgi:hypothetical protein
MSEHLETWIFFAILVLVPLGMLTGIILFIVTRIRGRSGLKALAEQLGLEFFGNSQDGVNRIKAILEPTLFATRRGRHSIRSTAAGEVDGAGLWLAEYHYKSLAVGSARAGGSYALLVMERASEGPEFMLQHRQQGALAAIAEGLAGDQIVPAWGDEWSWALVTSNEALAKLPHPVGAGLVLRDATIPGDFFFFFPQLIIWARRGDLSRKWTEKVPEIMSILSRFR